MANVSSSNGLEKRPKLRFPGFDEPWKAEMLSDFSERVTRKNTKNETNLPLTISSKDGLVDQISYFNKMVASKDISSYYLLKEGEYAYNKSYSVGYDFGSIKRLDHYPMGALSTLYICFALKRHNSDFIRAYFDSLKWYREIYMISAEGARNHGLLNVPTEDFFQTIHYLPQDTREQRKIANFIITLDRRIDAQQSLVKSLKKYKRGLLNKLFSNINSNIYPTVYLSEVADFLQGLTYSPSDVSVSGYLVLRSSNIQNGMLSFDDCVYVDKKVDESLQVKCDDVIMCVRNGSKNLVGKTALIPPNMPMTTWGAFMMIIRSKLNDTYIFHYLNSQMFFSQVFKDTGTATINQITKGILNECRLPLPPETERKQISKMLSSFDAKIQNAEKCLATLVNLKKALLQQLFI
ncbi:restriction endonuclease subunit S [Clostridium sp. J1101437_171009_A5]|uniref:restriction endonuclease subunit S n=1 Tax=Clostridium sp. J1101437_171009_A5 TaxID=2787098 RepID=UPI0025709C8E|nr:restriction endonuclease subunit S [Clostridium sp. J1101437_171009_A5]